MDEKKRFFLKIAFITIFILCPMTAIAAADSFVASDSPVLQRIQKLGMIRVGINPIFKPFSFVGKDGNRVGIDIDIAKLLAKQLGVKLELIVPESFSQLIPMLQKEDIDVVIAGMTINFNRAKLVDFTDPYFDTGLSIMLNKVSAGKARIPPAQSYKELMEGLKAIGKEDSLIIAVTKDRSPAKSVPIFFPKAQIREYPTNEKAAEAVLHGDAHIMIHDELFLNAWFNDHKQEALYKLFVFPEPFKPDHYGFAIKKGNQTFLNMLNVFVMELRVEGYLERFTNKYPK
ncbi:MAG TPA: transporter substrate-binding domain-containing protein [Desulfatiglandales bacterium]|nr:transporter substrate-binding domain-containing protein [Desulfatiglandales bacterium]